MFRGSPIRRNEVNRSAGRMGPRTRRPLQRGMSPVPLPQRGPSSAMPKVLPPHLVEKNQRVEFLRKLGLGRRKADQIGRRSYFSRDVDNLLRGMMRVPPADEPRLQKEQDAAMLEKVLRVFDTPSKIAVTLPRSPVPIAPSPPRNINWMGSPMHPSGSTFYSRNPILDRRPMDMYLGIYNDTRNTNLYNRNPNACSTPYGHEPIIRVTNSCQENPSFINSRQEPDSVQQMDYMYQFSNESINGNNPEISYRSYTDDSGNVSLMPETMSMDNYSSNMGARYHQPNRPYICNNEPTFNLQQSNNMLVPMNNGNRYNRPPIDNSNPHYAATKRMHPHSTDRESQIFSKRQRRRGFYIGGYRLPYVDTHLEALPQPEVKSYATKFFRWTPNYIIGSCVKECETVYLEDEFSDDDSLTGDLALDEEGNPISLNVRRCVKQCVIESLCLEWVKIYRPKNYRNWHNWWKDFMWCDSGIDKQLERFNGYNLKQNFIPHVPSDPGKDETSPTDKMIKKMLKSAHLSLVKNRNRYYRNVHTIYQLMDETFLGSLSLSNIEQLLDMIRSVPNHLWVYKMRSMVYMWSKYCDIHTKQPDVNSQNFLATTKEWNSPVFHWLAKQAINELKCISKIEWGGHMDYFEKDFSFNHT